MHKGFDFQETGGFPFDQQTLEYLQEAYSDIADKVLTGIFGDNVIVCGCEEAGTNVGDGWIVLNGQLLPFHGGVVSEYIHIREDEEIPPLVFADNIGREVKFSRFAQFGSSTVNYKWADIKNNRLTSLKDISEHLNILPKQVSSNPADASRNCLATSAAVNSVYSTILKKVYFDTTPLKYDISMTIPLFISGITEDNPKIYFVFEVYVDSGVNPPSVIRTHYPNLITSYRYNFSSSMPDGMRYGELTIEYTKTKLNPNWNYTLMYALIKF